MSDEAPSPNQLPVRQRKYFRVGWDCLRMAGQILGHAYRAVYLYGALDADPGNGNSLVAEAVTRLIHLFTAL
ncbi:hypothetical protein [Nocardia yamanashiensis]|uniref:hypothetical protein n=1 Tax=Nocardia yamanashiensis TaxID=209247 RepID=UPI000ACE5CC2|nr:hypothetical protein [Nocardia yamanashiensis]